MGRDGGCARLYFALMETCTLRDTGHRVSRPRQPAHEPCRRQLPRRLLRTPARHLPAEHRRAPSPGPGGGLNPPGSASMPRSESRYRMSWGNSSPPATCEHQLAEQSWAPPLWPPPLDPPPPGSIGPGPPCGERRSLGIPLAPRSPLRAGCLVRSVCQIFSRGRIKGIILGC